MPLVTSVVAIKIFRNLCQVLSMNNLFITGIVFALEGILAANILSKLLEKFITPNEGFLYYVITLIIVPIISFWAILGLVHAVEEGAKSLLRKGKKRKKIRDQPEVPPI